MKISELAKELNIDRQRLYRYCKNNCITDTHNESPIQLTDTECDTIRAHFQQMQGVERDTENVSSDTENVSSDTENISSDTELIQLLKQQIEIKDRQIEELHILVAQHVQTIQEQQKLLPGHSAAVAEEEPQPRKKSIWQAIFK